MLRSRRDARYVNLLGAQPLHFVHHTNGVPTRVCMSKPRHNGEPKRKTGIHLVCPAHMTRMCFTSTRYNPSVDVLLNSCLARVEVYPGMQGLTSFLLGTSLVS